MSKGISQLQLEILDCLGKMARTKHAVVIRILSDRGFRTIPAVPVKGLLWEIAKRRNQTRERGQQKGKRAWDSEIPVSFRHSFYRSLKLLMKRGTITYYTSKDKTLLVTASHDN